MKTKLKNLSVEFFKLIETRDKSKLDSFYNDVCELNYLAESYEDENPTSHPDKKTIENLYYLSSLLITSFDKTGIANIID